MALSITSLILWAERINRRTKVSGDGLEVSGFHLSCPGEIEFGKEVMIVFRLKNVTDYDITFHENYGVFVGARRSGQNCDFGHRDKGRTLHPGESVKLKAVCQLEEHGQWIFWPAYHANGHWEPYKWNSIKISVD